MEQGLFPVIHAPTDSRLASLQPRDAKCPKSRSADGFIKGDFGTAVRFTPRRIQACTRGDNCSYGARELSRFGGLLASRLGQPARSAGRVEPAVNVRLESKRM